MTTGLISAFGKLTKTVAYTGAAVGAGAYAAARTLTNYCPTTTPSFLQRIFSTTPTVVERACQAAIPVLESAGTVAAPVALGCAAAAYAAHRYVNRPIPITTRLREAAADKIEGLREALARKRSSPVRFLPYVGVAAGLVTGTLGRVLDPAGSLASKSKELCRSAFSYDPLLQSINSFKQWEIKNVALLTPLIPVATKIIVDAIRCKEVDGILPRLRAAVGRDSTQALLKTLALGIFGAMMIQANEGLWKEQGFDLSGHVMLKTVLAQFVSLSLNEIARSGGEGATALCAAFGGLYAFTDAVLLHNTARACHTALEVLAGLGAGCLVGRLANRFFQDQPRG